MLFKFNYYLTLVQLRNLELFGKDSIVIKEIIESSDGDVEYFVEFRIYSDTSTFAMRKAFHYGAVIGSAIPEDY